MKRSEMVEHIKHELLDFFDIYGLTSDKAKPYVLKCRTEGLLDMLEGFGMRPPRYMKPIPFESDGTQYPLVPGDFKENGVWCTPVVQEWEPEDEN